MSLFGGGNELSNDESVLTSDEDAVLDKIARKAVDKGWSVPAILFLESVKPLNFLGSQTMVFFEPIVQTLFSFRDYTTFREALEKRESIEILLLRIEEYDAVSLTREKRIKKFLKKEKKKWKWYQRWLGVAIPKFDIPDEVSNEPDEKPPDQGKSPA